MAALIARVRACYFRLRYCCAVFSELDSTNLAVVVSLPFRLFSQG